jgi:predicted RNase H-like HicB family nuclease
LTGQDSVAVIAVASRDEEIMMQVTAILTPAPEGGYSALNPETGTASQGETVEEALGNLREAVELYLEEFPLISSGPPIVTMFHVQEHA